MRATIVPVECAIRVDDELVIVPSDKMPAGPELAGFVPDTARPIRTIHFDGAVGVIERRSRAPGRIDIEHFVGFEPLAPYLAAFGIEKERRAEAKRKADTEEEARAQASLKAAAVAQIEADKAEAKRMQEQEAMVKALGAPPAGKPEGASHG